MEQSYINSLIQRILLDEIPLDMFNIEHVEVQKLAPHALFLSNLQATIKFINN